MFKWVYRATIYRKSDGKVLKNEIFKTYFGAKRFIENNIIMIGSKYYPPTGHITKECIKFD